MKDHALKLKRTHVATDDEILKNANISKLTIDKLKAELLHRSLSTTHNKKVELVNRLSSCLLNVKI